MALKQQSMLHLCKALEPKEKEVSDYDILYEKINTEKALLSTRISELERIVAKKMSLKNI